MTEKKENDFKTQARIFWHLAQQVRRGFPNGNGGFVRQTDQEKMNAIHHYETNFVWDEKIETRLGQLKTEVLNSVKRLNHEFKDAG